MSIAEAGLVETMPEAVGTEGSMIRELERIIAHMEVETLFQPIYDLASNTLFAHEALSRGPRESQLFMPDILFETARKQKRVADLDCICRKRAIENFQELRLPGKLSVNICPSSLIDPHFKSGRTMRFLQETGFPSERVILELTEQRRVDHEALKSAARHYQEMGFSIALDDLGAGYSSLRLLAELRPDYLKLDKYFVSGVHQNLIEADFIKLIVDLATRVGCKVIAEGIESAEELQFVRAAGITYGQGYLLGRPEYQAADTVPDILLETGRMAGEESPVADGWAPAVNTLGERELVSSLNLHPTPACTTNDMVSEMLHRFQANPQLLAIPVVKGERVVGALTRDEILNAFSTPYAHSLYHRASVEKLMLRTPLIVQMSDSLAHASQLATKRPYNLVYSPLIVCDGERYVGMASIRELLEKITNIQLEHALHCNPLSGLPGNVRIDSEVQGRLDERRSFTLAHLDLDNFKAFNDYYGYERGDKMICLVADVLRMSSAADEFVGHIGGDDFVMILEGEAFEARIGKLLDGFQQQSAMLYDARERQQGYIETSDRSGQLRRFSLASLSVSALPCPPERFVSHLQAAEVIAELKHQSKKVEGNSLVIDRRQSGH